MNELIGRLVRLSPDQRVALMRALQAPVAYDAMGCNAAEEAGLPALIARQAASTPEAAAVVAGTVTLRFGELECRANRLAGVLQVLGVGAGVRVAVLLERSPLLVTALLAILKAGGVCVPVAPGLAPKCRRWILADSAAEVLIADARTRKLLDEEPASSRWPLLLLADQIPEQAAAAASATHGADSGRPACLVYSRTLAGRPEGATYSHRALLELLGKMLPAGPPGAGTPDDRQLGAMACLRPLLSGAALVLADDGAAADCAAAVAPLPRTGVNAAAESGRPDWVSAYTGQPWPAEEIRERLDARAEVILALRPRRVLTIGQGAGGLMRRLASACEHHMELMPGFGPDCAGLDAGGFDMVLLDAGLQAEPGRLTRTLDLLLPLLAPAARIFIGGVLRPELAAVLHSSVQLYRATAETRREEIRKRVRQALSGEPLCPPTLACLRNWVAEGPRRSLHCELERGRFHNEFTRFHCNVIVRIGGAEDESGGDLPGAAGFDEVALAAQMSAQRQPVWLRDLPNARLVGEVAAAEWIEGRHGRPPGGMVTVADWRRRRPRPAGFDPHLLQRLANHLQGTISIRPPASGRLDTMDVWFRPGLAPH